MHTDAPTADATDWAQVVELYDQLHALQPNDIVRLNRAIALAELRGAAAGLEAVEELHLDEYHLSHATRAELLARTGDIAGSHAAYDRAIQLTTNEAERRFLSERRMLLDRR